MESEWWWWWWWSWICIITPILKFWKVYHYWKLSICFEISVLGLSVDYSFDYCRNCMRISRIETNFSSIGIEHFSILNTLKMYIVLRKNDEYLGKSGYGWGCGIIVGLCVLGESPETYAVRCRAFRLVLVKITIGSACIACL